MEMATSDIRPVEFTPTRDGDSPVLPGLLDQIPENGETGTVTADGAYDIRGPVVIVGPCVAWGRVQLVSGGWGCDRGALATGFSP